MLIKLRLQWFQILHEELALDGGMTISLEKTIEYDILVR